LQLRKRSAELGSRILLSARGHRLRVEFDYVEAFKVYEEFSDPWTATGLPLPQLEGADKTWRYPLQEVMHSSWVARVTARNGGIEGLWRHFVITTMDRTLHVMTSGEPRNGKLTAS